MASDGKNPTLYTLTLTEAQGGKLRMALATRGWELKEVEHALWGFAGDKVQVVFYKSGKLVVQGKGTQDFVQNILEPEITGVALLGYDALHHPDWFETHAGLDEAGKGDLFGPLTTACVVAGGAAVEYFIKSGIKDSKRLSDGEVLRLEKVIRQTHGVAVATAACGMERYNELMRKPRANLNRLLAWLHSKSLGEALDKLNAPWGLLDQFAKKDSVEEYLARPAFELRRRTKAESDPVVAAASIVARAEYLKALKRLSEAAGKPLPKGSSKQAQEFLRDMRGEIGVEKMDAYAKMHFKLRAIGEAPPED